MSAYLLAATAMLVVAAPCGLLLLRGRLMAAVVALQVLSSVTVMVLALVAEGLGRSGEFELPLLMALLLFGGGMVFVRALERWL